MAIRYKRINTPQTTAGGDLFDALAGLGEKKRRIRALYPVLNYPSVAFISSINLLAVKEQEEMVEFDVNLFIDFITGGTPAWLDVSRRIEVDILLERGDGFKVGYSDTSASNESVIMEYEDLE